MIAWCGSLGALTAQNTSDLDLAVVILIAPSNRYADLAPLMEEARAALRDTPPGRIAFVSA